MVFKYIDQSLKKAWENLVEQNSSSGFMQSFFWTEFTNLLGWPTFKIGSVDSGKLIGGAIVTKFTTDNGHNYLYIPEGPVVPYEESSADKIFDALISEIDKIADLTGDHRTSHLRIDPKLTSVPSFLNRFQKAPVNLEPLRTLLIDLSLPKEKILAQMKPKGRYNIKVAQRHKLEVRSTTLQSGLNSFLNFYQQTVNRKQFKGKDEIYFIKLAKIIGSLQEAKFFFISDQKNILAVALIIFYGELVTFLFGASSNDNRHKMAPYLLHWEIICRAKEMGYRFYDFYGIVPDENDVSHPWQGFTAFKKKFGGQEVKYIGAYDFVYNQELYKDYLKL